jgi:hypothetical protein
MTRMTKEQKMTMTKMAARLRLRRKVDVRRTDFGTGLAIRDWADLPTYHPPKD